jgi:flagellum-specific peptidoglycan hydrolase FlgJ
MAIKNRVGKAVAEDLDFKFDFDDFEDQFPDQWDTVSDEYSTAEKNRSPVTKARNNVIAGLKDSMLTRTGMEEVLRAAFPSEYGETYDNISAVLSGVNESTDMVKKEFNRIKSRGKSYLRQLAPVGDMIGLKSLTDKLNNWGKEDFDGSDDYGQNNVDKEKQREDSIQSSLGELFSVQNRIAEKRAKLEEVKRDAKDAVETVRFQGQIGVLSSIDASLRNTVSFQNKNTYNYYRKSIELQLRKYHLLSDIYNTQTKTSEALIQTLNEIKLNTGLPEFVKMRTSEAAKQMIRSKAFEGVHKTIFGNGDFITNFTNNLLGATKSAIGSVNDFMDLLDPMVEQGISAIVDDDPLGRDALHSATASVAPTLFGFLGKKMLQMSNKTKFGKKVYKNASRLKSFNDNLGENVLKSFTGGKVREFGRKLDKSGEFTDPIVDFFQQLVYQSVNKKSTTSLDIEGYENYGDQLGREQLVSKAQRVVIPGYLARILRELTIIRTGQDVPLLEYNYRSNKFTSSTSLTKDIVKSAVGKANVNLINSLGNNAFSTAGMFTTNKLTGEKEMLDGFTREDMLAVGNVLITAASENKTIDARFLTNPNSFKDAIGEEKAKILAARYRKVSREDKKSSALDRARGLFGYETDRIGSLGSNAKSTLKSFSIPENTLQAIVNAGYGGKLREIGLIDAGGTVNVDKLVELTRNIDSLDSLDESFGLDDVVGGLKQNRSSKSKIKNRKGAKPSPSNDLDPYQVGGRTIIPGITPNRPQDHVSQTQGLASYLADSSDTPYLEIISHQLSSLNETLSAASGYIPQTGGIGSDISSGVSKAYDWVKKVSKKSYDKVSEKFHEKWDGELGDTIKGKAREYRIKAKLARRKLDKKTASTIDRLRSKGLEVQDLFHKNFDEPIMTARGFIEGKYRDAEGKVIKSINDIKSTVFDEEGNVVLTMEDIRDTFYVGAKGKLSRSKHFQKLLAEYEKQKGKTEKRFGDFKDEWKKRRDQFKEDWEEGKIQDDIKGKARETGSKIKDFLGNAVSDLAGFTKNLNLPKPSTLQDVYFNSIARNTATTNDLLMEMSLKLENLQLMAVNQFATGENLPPELRPRFMQRVKNLFARKRSFQFPNQQKHIAQRIWEFGGWAASSTATMGMALTKAMGNITGKGLKFGLSGATSLTGLGLDMGGDLLKSLKGQTKTTSKRAIDIADNAKGKVLDVYLKGHKEPILKAREMKKGNYYDEQGNPITQFVDIKSDVYDVEGNVVCSYDDFKKGYVKDSGTYKLVKTFNWFKDRTIGISTKLGSWGYAGLTLPAKIVKAGVLATHGVLRRKLRMQLKDIYVKGHPETPILYAKDIRAGKYFDKETGNPIVDIADVSGPVVDADGNEVLTREDLRLGLVDRFGKEFTDHYRNFSGTKQWLIAKGVGLGIDAAKGSIKLGIAGIRMGVRMGAAAYRSAKSILGLSAKGAAKGLRIMGGAYTSIYDKLTGKIKDPSDALFAGLSISNETNQYLFAIHSLLDQRIPVPSSGVFGDRDGDGDRENGIADIKQRNRLAKLREAEEKALAKRDKNLANMIGDAIRGKNGKKSKEEEKEEDGIFDNIIEGLTQGVAAKLLGALGLGGLLGGGGRDGGVDVDASDLPDGDEKGSKKGGKGSSRKPKSRAAKMRQAMSQKFRRSKAGKSLLNAKNAMMAGGRNVMAAGTTAMASTAGAVKDFASPYAAKVGSAASKVGSVAMAGGQMALSAGGKALSFAGKALPVVGGLYAGYSGVQNLMDGNYGMAALDLGMASAGIFGVGSTLSAIGSGLGMAGGLLAAALPWALAAGGVALAGYGIYKGARKLYDMYKGSKVGDLEKARLMLYGFDHDKDDSWSSKILKFERIVMDAVVTGPNGITIDKTKVDPDDTYDIFGFDKEDALQSQRWVNWFNKRFIPAFTKSVSALKSINPKYDIQDTYDLEGEEARKYLNAIKPNPGEYSEMHAPFKDMQILACTGADAAVFIEKVLEKLNKGESLNNPGLLKKTASAVWKVATAPFRLAASVAEGTYNAAKWVGKKVFNGLDTVMSSKLMSYTPMGMIWNGIKSALDIKSDITATNGDTAVGADGKYDPFLSVKYKAYGLSNLSDTTRISILNQLEKAAGENISWSGKAASYSGDVVDLIKETYTLFGIKENDESGMEILGKYLKYRFLPVFVNLVTAMNKHLNTTDINAVVKARPAIKMLIVNDIVNVPVEIDGVKTTIWSFSLSPFGTTLNTNRSSVDGDVDKLKKEVDSKGQSDAKVKAEEAANESKSFGDRIKEMNKTLFNLTPVGMMKNLLDKMLPDSVKDKISEVGNNIAGYAGDVAQEIESGYNRVVGNLTGSNDEKFKKVMQAAANAGDPHPAVVAAQWAVESGWGAKESGKNNFFGIKAKPGQPGTVRRTREVLNGRTVYINDRFADYNSLEEGIAARVAFTKQNKRYTNSGYFAARTPFEAAQALQRGGYATDPNYANSLAAIIKGRKIDPMRPVVIKPTGTASSGTPAGVNTREDWNKSQQALNNSTAAPSKEYRDKMNSFGQARQYVMNNKSLTDVQRKQALLKINNEAHAYMMKNNPEQIDYNYDTSSRQNTGTKVNAKTKPGMVAAWCTKNGSIAHSILGKKKGGNCAATVGLGLYNAGYIKTARGNGHAYSYGQKLLNLGWKEVTGQSYQVGDIAVCYPNPRAASSGGRKYGHVSVFNGSVWWADIPCHSPCPYRDRNTAGYVVKVYRDGNYMNGGTAVDDMSSRGGFASTVGSTYNSGMNNAIGQNRTFRGSTVNGKVTKEQIEKGKILAKLGYTKDGVSQASKLYSYTTPEAAANMYNYDTSTTVSDKTDGKSKIKVGNVYVDPNTISTDSNITITRDILKDVSKYGNVFNPENSEPNDALGRLQASIRKLLGVGNIDATMVKTALASTELKREEMQKETQGTTLLSMALDKAKRAVVATTDKNNLKESTKASVEQSKAIKNDLLSVSNEILKEAKEQTKLLTDILSTIRKEKSKPGKEDNSFTPKERVSFRESINGSSDLKNPAAVRKPIVSMAK